VVAGGAALIAQDLVDRTTYDIDLFLVEAATHIGQAADAFEAQAHTEAFDLRVFADMLGSIQRLPDDEIPVPPDDVPTVRAYFDNWRNELIHAASSEPSPPG